MKDLKLFKEIIEEARNYVTKRVDDGSERRWLSAYADSYDNPSQRISLYVLEGSPPRGYIIVNHTTKTVYAFSSDNRRLRTWSHWKEMMKE